jgi:hypothetical protein
VRALLTWAWARIYFTIVQRRKQLLHLHQRPPKKPRVSQFAALEPERITIKAHMRALINLLSLSSAAQWQVSWWHFSRKHLARAPKIPYAKTHRGSCFKLKISSARGIILHSVIFFCIPDTRVPSKQPRGRDGGVIFLRAHKWKIHQARAWEAGRISFLTFFPRAFFMKCWLRQFGKTRMSENHCAAERVRDESFKEHKQALFLSNYNKANGEFFLYCSSHNWKWRAFSSISLIFSRALFTICSK